MSLQDSFPTDIPETTRQMVEPILPLDSVCRLLGNHAEELINEEELARMYHREGCGGINPVLLSFVLILQFLEDIPDRLAAQMVLFRLDWKYALRQELTWRGFNFSSLSNFRKRLREHNQEFIIFEQLIAHLKQAGYIQSQRQRTDASHILGAVEHLSRLELVWETLRLAVVELINQDAQWVLHQLPPSFVSDHSQRRSDYRLKPSAITRAMAQAGQDGLWLLEQVKLLEDIDGRTLPAVEMLRRVWDEQFEMIHDDPASLQIKANTDASGDVIASPHDGDVRYSQKGKSTQWEGYKVQVTETVDGKLPLITDIDIHSAIEADSPALETIQKRLQDREMLPEQQYVDRAYCNGKTLVSSQKRGIDLRGYVPSCTRKPVGFRLEDFQIDLHHRRAVCPQGHLAGVFNASSQDDVAFHIRFGKVCQTCPVKHLCTTSKRGRSLEISPYHEQLTKRRQAQQTTSFAREMYARSRIESTICELMRKHGLRQSRYRGQHKVRLQAAFTAVAVNLKRLARYLAQQMSPISTHLLTLFCYFQFKLVIMAH
jgi:transposase